MTGGSSGGPWLISNNTVLNSVNSFGYQGLRNVMFGPCFGSQVQTADSTAFDPLTPTNLITRA